MCSRRERCGLRSVSDEDTTFFDLLLLALIFCFYLLFLVVSCLLDRVIFNRLFFYCKNHANIELYWVKVVVCIVGRLSALFPILIGTLKRIEHYG